MKGGNHSNRDAVPFWAIVALIAFIACGLLWSAWAILFA